ncbi:MAG TPA: ABC transporter substrate-binding protein [Microvirga sp.]|jgi:putative ABC transport system substrate-binding protein|nr:ABC transporter substrate-binding protein [Microvirga sp.]
MRRRAFLLGCAAAACPRPGLTQGRRAPARVGFLALGSPAVAERRLRSFRQGLADLGLQEGHDYGIDARVAGADPDALNRAAADLAASAPDVLVTHATGTAAMRRATGTIPIVMVSGDAVTTGLVASLQRPGGNVTGVSFLSPELMAKRTELLKEVLPAIEEMGLLALGGGYRVTDTVVQAVEAVARGRGMGLQPALVRNPADIERAFADWAARRVRGIVVQDEPMLIANARRIVESATARGILAVGFLELAAQGGHVAYSINFDAVWQRVASFAAKILQGARPEDLPVEQPNRFELVVNLKALRGLNIDAPTALLARADEVIE